MTKDISIQQATPWNTSYAVHMKIGKDVAQPVLFTRVEESVMTEPCFSLTKNEMQSLMDEIWRAGFRPSEGSGSAGSLKATQKHLEDMRTLVFKEKKCQ